MATYDINNYDFINNDEFQAFFKSKLPNEYISRAEFIRMLNKCKREWINMQHNVNYLAEKCRKANEA